MPALNTDLFKKLSRRWVGQIGSGGVADNSTTTIPLASTTNLPTGTAIVATIDRVDANGSATSSIEETVIGVVSGSNLINCLRGSEGTAQAHSAGAVVEILVTAKGYNDIIDGILAEHTQLGVHNIPTTSLLSQYAADTGSANAYAVTLSPVPGVYVAGEIIQFKAANANTTASTLAVNGGAAKAIKKKDGITALSANDIKAGQIVAVQYDGTNFQMVSPSAINVNTIDSQTLTNKTMDYNSNTFQNFPTSSSDGWVANANTWTYSSVDGPTGVVTINADLTGIIGVGDRIKFTQTTAKYFIVTKISVSGGTTTLTFYGGTDYTLANAAISATSYSHATVPFGFNPDPAKWTETLSDASDRSQSSPVTGTWYNLGSLSLNIPIGAWHVRYKAAFQGNTTAQPTIKVTLSTVNNTESDNELTCMIGASASSALVFTPIMQKQLLLTSKTPYYLNARLDSGASSIIGFYGASYYPTVIKAVCAYL